MDVDNSTKPKPEELKRLNLKNLGKSAKNSDNLLLLIGDEKDAGSIGNCLNLTDAVFIFQSTTEGKQLLDIFLLGIKQKKYNYFTLIFVYQDKLESAIVIGDDTKDKKAVIIPFAPFERIFQNESSGPKGDDDDLFDSYTMINHVLESIYKFRQESAQPLCVMMDRRVSELLKLRESLLLLDINRGDPITSMWILAGARNNLEIVGLMNPLFPAGPDNPPLKTKMKLVAAGIVTNSIFKNIKHIGHHVNMVKNGKYSGGGLSYRDYQFKYFLNRTVNKISEKNEDGDVDVMEVIRTLGTKIVSSFPTARDPENGMMERFNDIMGPENIGLDKMANDQELYSIRKIAESFELLQNNPELLKSEIVTLTCISESYRIANEQKIPYYLPDGTKIVIEPPEIVEIDEIDEPTEPGPSGCAPS